MEQKNSKKTATIAVLFMVLVAGMAVKGEGTVCGATFFASLVQMIPCRAAVAPFSPAPPSEACCNAVKVLGQPCMCLLVNGPTISGVDRYMAMQLPDKCAANFEPCSMSK